MHLDTTTKKTCLVFTLLFSLQSKFTADHISKKKWPKKKWFLDDYLGVEVIIGTLLKMQKQKQKQRNKHEFLLKESQAQ